MYLYNANRHRVLLRENPLFMKRSLSLLPPKSSYYVKEEYYPIRRSQNRYGRIALNLTKKKIFQSQCHDDSDDDDDSRE